MAVKKVKKDGKDITTADLPGGGLKVWDSNGEIHTLGPPIKTPQVKKPVK